MSIAELINCYSNSSYFGKILHLFDNDKYAKYHTSKMVQQVSTNTIKQSTKRRVRSQEFILNRNMYDSQTNDGKYGFDENSLYNITTEVNWKMDSNNSVLKNQNESFKTKSKYNKRFVDRRQLYMYIGFSLLGLILTIIMALMCYSMRLG